MTDVETIAELSPDGLETAGTVSDRLLWARYVQHGDESAFADLVQRHGRTVWGVCRRLLRQEQDVEDAVQAVFLVLARKIASIRKGEAVGSWLYGVAYRTAMKVRRSAARRRVHEQRAPIPTPEPASPPSEAACRELQRMLDEEVERLAPKFRAPFVLCCLEGMSRAEAAAELGWKEGTVSGRLAQARKVLQSRLAKRGITLSASLTAGALSQTTGTTGLPAVLGPATVKAVLAAATSGNAAPATVSPAVLALADSLTRSLTAIKLKLALWLGMAITLATGISLAAIPDKPAPIAPAPQKAPMVEAAQPEPPPKAPAQQPGGRFSWVGGLAFSHDTKRLANSLSRTDQPGHLRIWDVALINDVLNITDVPLPSAVALSPDGQTLAVAELAGDVRLREAATGQVKAVLKRPGNTVNKLAFSPDGSQLLAGDSAGALTLWNVDAPASARVFRGHQGPISDVAFLHRRAAVISASQDGTARIWATDTGKEQRVLSGHRDGITNLTVAGDDSLVATLGQDRTLRVWDLETGQETASLDGKTGGITALAFSPDGKMIAIAAPNGTLRLWDVKTQKIAKHLETQVRAMHALAFTPDGKHLAAGSNQIAGIVVLDVGESDSGKTSTFKEYYSSLKGGANLLRDFSLIGSEASECVHFEPQGLRITLPAGKPATDQGTGAAPVLDVGGDFDITVNYEILHEPEPEENQTNTRFSLAILLNRRPAHRNMASVTRRVSKETRQFALWHILQGDDPPEQAKKRAMSARASARTGRLRLRRTGTLLSYYVADGATGPFKLFRQIPFVSEDLTEVRMVASTGGPKASLDVRFTDLRIRADSLPNVPDTIGGPLAQMSTSDVSRFMPAALVAILGFAGCLGIATAVWLRRRSQRAVWVIPLPEQGAQEIVTEPMLVYNCTNCGKKLRGGPDLAGKMIKCPQCAQTMRLPER